MLKHPSSERGNALRKICGMLLMVHLTMSSVHRGPHQLLHKEEVGEGGTRRPGQCWHKDLMLTEGMLINYSILAGTETEFKEQSTYKPEHSQRIAVSEKAGWERMDVCTYRHIYLRSHFCKTVINFKIVPVFECRYTYLLVFEHKSLEKRERYKPGN